MEDNYIINIPTEHTLRKVLKEELLEAISTLTAQLEIVIKSQGKPKYLSVQETANILHTSCSTIRRWADTGYLTKKRIGKRVLFSYEEIEQKLERRQQMKWRIAS